MLDAQLLKCLEKEEKWGDKFQVSIKLSLIKGVDPYEGKMTDQILPDGSITTLKISDWFLKGYHKDIVEELQPEWDKESMRF